MNSFFAMGGYAFYVWASYGLALVVLGGLFIASRHTLRRTEATLATLEQARGGGRSRRRAAQAGAPGAGPGVGPGAGGDVVAGRLS